MGDFQSALGAFERQKPKNFLCESFFALSVVRFTFQLFFLTRLEGGANSLPLQPETVKTP
jgi:hypothetical protein